MRGFYHHSAVWTGDEMIVWGWVHGTTGEENEAAAYDPATDTWRTLPPAPLPPARPCECNGGQSAVWTGDRMLAWSGTLDVDGPLMLSLDPATGEWQRLDRLDGDAAVPPVDGVDRLRGHRRRPLRLHPALTLTDSACVRLLRCRCMHAETRGRWGRSRH